MMLQSEHIIRHDGLPKGRDQPNNLTKSVSFGGSC